MSGAPAGTILEGGIGGTIFYDTRVDRDALDRVAQYQHDVRTLRFELVQALRTFREAVWDAQRRHPEVTYNAAKVHRALADLTILLDRLAALLHTP